MERFDFDAKVDRCGTGCVKWDSVAEGVIPMWVADMDFRTAPAIVEALQRRVAHGVFGYTRVPDRYYECLNGWFSRRHGYDIKRESVIYVPGVVPAISAIIKALVAPGEGVIVMTPVYNCFFSSIRNNGCKIVENKLKRVDIDKNTFIYDIDFENLEQLAADGQNKMLLLCNPHNPAGRLWTEDELKHIANICKRHDLALVSDEIHCDLTMPGYTFVSMARVCPDAIICNSPSKAFNTAGLQIANIIVNDEKKRNMIDRAVNVNEVCDVNPFGVEGLMAAYTDGEPWLKALLEYLDGNYQIVKNFFATELPEYPITKLEATYLVWIDVTASGLDGDTLTEMLTDKFGVMPNGGGMYGDNRYIRLNIATRRELLQEGLNRMKQGLTNL